MGQRHTGARIVRVPESTQDEDRVLGSCSHDAGLAKYAGCAGMSMRSSHAG